MPSLKVPTFPGPYCVWVEDVFIRTVHTIYHVWLDGKEEIKTTAYHPVYVQEQGWVTALPQLTLSRSFPSHWPVPANLLTNFWASSTVP